MLDLKRPMLAQHAAAGILRSVLFGPVMGVHFMGEIAGPPVPMVTQVFE